MKKKTSKTGVRKFHHVNDFDIHRNCAHFLAHAEQHKVPGHSDFDSERANIIICRHHITSIRASHGKIAHEADDECNAKKRENVNWRYERFDIKCISSLRMTRNIFLPTNDVKELISIDRMKPTHTYEL